MGFHLPDSSTSILTHTTSLWGGGNSSSEMKCTCTGLSNQFSTHTYVEFDKLWSMAPFSWEQGTVPRMLASIALTHFTLMGNIFLPTSLCLCLTEHWVELWVIYSPFRAGWFLFMAEVWCGEKWQVSLFYFILFKVGLNTYMKKYKVPNKNIIYFQRCFKTVRYIFPLSSAAKKNIHTETCSSRRAQQHSSQADEISKAWFTFDNIMYRKTDS